MQCSVHVHVHVHVPGSGEALRSGDTKLAGNRPVPNCVFPFHQFSSLCNNKKNNTTNEQMLFTSSRNSIHNY